MKKSNVYTCTGDGGQTSLADGTRASKCCARLESYGEVDELNCHVGLLLSLVANEQIEEMLLEVQRTLFSVGAMLATPPQAAHADAMPSPANRYMPWSTVSTCCTTDCRPGADLPFREAPRLPRKPRCAGLSAAGQNAASAPLPRWREEWILACWPTSTA